MAALARRPPLRTSALVSARLFMSNRPASRISEPVPALLRLVTLI